MDRRVKTLAVPGVPAVTAYGVVVTPAVPSIAASTSDWTVVCAKAVRTSCRDTSPPAASLLQVVEYSVVGYDLDASGLLREGDRSAVQAVDPALPPPGTPPTLSALLVNSHVALTWTAPADVLPPDHYNVYRGGQSYADRLDSVYITPGQPLTYTDTSAGGIGHDYWITAVNSQLGESAQVGPVRK